MVAFAESIFLGIVLRNTRRNLLVAYWQTNHIHMSQKRTEQETLSFALPNKKESRRVVTAFIEHNQSYLLFERVSTMPTYAGKWSGISGSVEKNEWPVDAAWREIEEETGLTKQNLCLLRAGLPLDVRDLGREFRVHPFLFRVVSLADYANLEQAIHLNSENNRFQLVDKDGLLQLVREKRTVPELDNTFFRVVDTLDKIPGDWQEEARLLYENRVSGATELAKKVAEMVVKGAPAEWVAALRPSMVSLVNVAYEVTRNSNVDIQAVLKQAVDAIVQSAGEQLIASGCHCIATFSSSSTVQRLLEWCDHRAYPLNVRIAESMPGGEGQYLYEQLLALVHKIELYQDDKLLQDSSVHLVITGADCLMQNDYFINKIGTKRLFETAKLMGISRWVLCDHFKRWRDTVPPPLEQDLFEIIPCNLVDRFFIDSNL
eukprot:jgi/Galph1/2527/GphlegSOOS_G1211.1